MYLIGIFLIASGNLVMSLAHSMSVVVFGQILMGFSTFSLMRFSVAFISDIT